MSKSPRRLLPPAAGKTHVEKLELENFARRLHDAMKSRGMSQSDLAREIWGATTDKRGYEVARNRDRISVYLAGKALPDEKNLRKLADALGVPEKELAPELVASAVERENPEIAMTMVPGHADKVYLRINKLVPLAIAAQVITLLSQVE